MMVMEAEYEKQTGYPFLDALPQPIKESAHFFEEA